MKRLLLAISTFLVLGSATAHAVSLTCEYNANLRGCTGEPRLKSIKLKIDGQKFTLLMNRDACYYQAFHEYRGIVDQGRFDGADLQSQYRRDLQMGEGQWKKDRTRFNLYVNLDTLEGKLNGRLPLKCTYQSETY